MVSSITPRPSRLSWYVDCDVAPVSIDLVQTAIGISSAALYMLFYALYASRTRHVRSISKQIGYNSFFDSLNSPDYVHRIWNQLDRKDFKFFLQNALGKVSGDHSCRYFGWF